MFGMEIVTRVFESWSDRLMFERDRYPKKNRSRFLLQEDYFLQLVKIGGANKRGTNATELDHGLFNGGQRSSGENGSLPRDFSVDFRGTRGCYESPRNPCVTRLYFQPRLFSFLKQQSSLVLAARGAARLRKYYSQKRRTASATTTFRKMFIPLTFIPTAYFRPISGVTFSFSSVAQT